MIENKNDKYTLLCLKKEERKKEREKPLERIICLDSNAPSNIRLPS